MSDLDKLKRIEKIWERMVGVLDRTIEDLKGEHEELDSEAMSMIPTESGEKGVAVG